MSDQLEELGLEPLVGSDLAPVIPPFMSRICSGYGPDRTGL